MMHYASKSEHAYAHNRENSMKNIEKVYKCELTSFKDMVLLRTVFTIYSLVVKTRKNGEKREPHKEACVDQISYMKSIRGKQQKAVKALE